MVPFLSAVAEEKGFDTLGPSGDFDPDLFIAA